MRGSSESVPTFNISLLPSAEYIGCCRDCSAACRGGAVVIVGERSEGLSSWPRAFRFAMRYMGRVSKARCQGFPNCQGAAAKREGQAFRRAPSQISRDRQGAAAKEDGGASGTSLPPVARNRQGAAAKREAGCIRKYPQLSQLPYVVEWAKARKSPPGQAPVTGAASVPDEVRNAAAKPFSLDTIKKRFLFSAQPIGAPTKAQRSGFCGEEEGQRSGMRDALPRRASRI